MSRALCGMIGKPDAEAVRLMAKALRHRADLAHIVSDDQCCFATDEALTKVPALLTDSQADGTPFAAVRREKDGRWCLLRDRMGLRPLYYYVGDGYLLFASELKAILASGRVRRRLNLAAVDRYFVLRCVPAPETVIHGIYKVRPGHCVTWDGLKAQESPVVTGKSAETPQSADARECAGRLKDLLERAALNCGEMGLLWSAGVDSAALAALNPAFKPLFVGLRTAWQDEARKAKESARLLGRPLEHHAARRLRDETFLKVGHDLDEPVSDAAAVPLWLLMEQAAEHGTSFAAGFGADELLGGYPRYHLLDKTTGVRHWIPRGFLAQIDPALPPNAFVQRASHYLAASEDDQASAYLALTAVFDEAERETMYTDAMKAALADAPGLSGTVTDCLEGVSFARGAMAFELNVGLPDLLIHQCDRFAAAHGIALRYPYLDDAVVDFALSTPPEIMNGVRSKPLLRMAMKGVLPARIRLRPRRGFRFPQSGPTWRAVENAAHTILTPERVDASGLFKWRAVETIIRGANHNVYRRRQFWSLLLFFAWYRATMEA